ncbi:MAG: response regulator, partial [Ramlibacter sp.]
RLVLKRQVNLLGYAAETAVDGAQAYEMFCTGRYGAVITDCNMPKMSGYDLARRIRASEATAGARRIPILACTANALQSEAAICLEAGMDDCLVKPAQLEGLASRLDQWLPMPATPPHPEEGGLPATPAPDPGVMDGEFLDEITGGEAAEQAHLLEEFSRHSRNDAEQLRKSLFEDEAPDQARHFAHRLRGASGVLRADSLSAACESIEDAAKSGNMEEARASFPALQAELRRVDAYVADRCRALRGRP